jgi:chromosome segregation ATPase
MQAARAAEAAQAARAEAADKHVHELELALHDRMNENDKANSAKLEGRAGLEGNLRKAEADRHNLEVQLDEMKGQLKKALDGTDLSSELTSMHDKVTRLEAEKSTVEGEAKSLELKATALAEQRTQSDTRNKELIDEIAQARDEIRTLQPEAASAKAARDQRGKRIKELEREVETVTKIREDSGGAGMSVERRMLHEVELTNK